MTRNKPLIMNAGNESNSLVISNPTNFSSHKASWQGIHVGHFQHSAAFETPEHCFSQHFISIHLNHATAVKEQVLGGRLRCDRFSDGDICLTPATAPVSVRLQDPCELICLYLEPAFFNKITAEVANSNVIEVVPQFKLNDPLIYQIAIALKGQMELLEKGSRLYAESMATAISAHLLQHYSTRKPKARNDSSGLSKTRLRQATDYIHERSAQNPSLTEIAQRVQMSPYYFSRLFKQSTGLSPHQYLIQCRIEEAKQLLNLTTLSIADIAVRAGFADQSHLARHFRRKFGVPPSQFR